MVYSLGNEGAKFLKKNFGWYVPKAGYQTEKNRRVKPVFIEHTLEIADFMIAIEQACSESKKFRFIPFDEIIATSPSGARRRKNLSKWVTTIH